MSGAPRRSSRTDARRLAQVTACEWDSCRSVFENAHALVELPAFVYAHEEVAHVRDKTPGGNGLAVEFDVKACIDDVEELPEHARHAVGFRKAVCVETSVDEGHGDGDGFDLRQVELELLVDVGENPLAGRVLSGVEVLDLGGERVRLGGCGGIGSNAHRSDAEVVSEGHNGGRASILEFGTERVIGCSEEPGIQRRELLREVIAVALIFGPERARDFSAVTGWPGFAIGVNSEEMSWMKAFNALGFSPLSSSVSSTAAPLAPLAAIPGSDTTASYANGTSLPMTTWCWPPAFMRVMTLSVSAILDSLTLDASLILKRRRVAQWVTELTLSAPPSPSSTACDSGSKSVFVVIVYSLVEELGENAKRPEPHARP